MSTANALDTTIAVVTPENIAFEYQLAGPFRRLPAYLIDLVVRSGLILVILIVLILLGVLVQLSVPASLLATLFIISYFLISWFYGTVMETYFNGRTVGKWACGLRVICLDGRPIDGTRAVIRNLLRIADLAPYAALAQLDEDIPPVFLIPTGIIGLVSIICTRRMQRLGDLAAGTMVVVDERSWRLPVTKLDDPRAAALASFIPGDYRVSRSMARTLATYVERRAYLTPARRREVAKSLAEPLLERFGFRPEIDPDLLMVALYHATFLADPRDPAVELGPLALHSPLLNAQPSVLPSEAGPPVVNGGSAAEVADQDELMVAEIIESPAPGARTESAK